MKLRIAHGVLISLFLSVNLLFSFSSIWAMEDNQMLIYSTEEQNYVSLENLISALATQDIVILGEEHTNPFQHENQKVILQELLPLRSVSVGLEFIDWTRQDIFDLYQEDQVDETTFLETINWGSIPFSFYRPLIQLAVSSGGHAYGINVPRWVTKEVVKVGWDKLSDEARSLIPEDFVTGNDQYFERFRKIMQVAHPVPEHILQRMFIAQSVWDDTMAYQTTLQVDNDLHNLFMVIVGNFHVEYKLGLPDRIRERSPEDSKVTVIAQVSLEHQTKEEALPYIQEDPDYGYLGDYILFTAPTPEEEL